MFFRLLVSVVLLTGFLFAQDDYKPWIKAERERYAKVLELSKIQYLGDTKIDVTYYGLDLIVTSSPQYLTGKVTVNADVDTTSLNTIFLDLRNALDVDSVWLNGTATTFTHSSHKLNIDLDRTYTQGESFSVKVFYQGVPGSSGFGSFEFSSHGGGIPAIWTLSEPYGAPDWFPCKDTPEDKADSSDVWITVADNLIPVSNGELMQTTNNGNGTHTYWWKNHYPIAHYLISMAITNYHVYTNYFVYTQTDSMPVIHFIYPENFNSVKSQLDKTPAMIEVFSDQFGLYPFIDEKYGHAQFGWSGGMEHQTISSMGGFSDGLMSHELAHQWYGDMITCKDWHHIWLNEGFATYLEAVYLEVTQGKAAYDSKIQSKMNSAKSEPQGSIWVEDITSVGQIFNYARSYAKGACVLHMLRGIVGDSTFFDIMRTYSADPSVSYGAVTTEDFQAIAESVYGSSLDYFFQEWIYGEKYPVYNVEWSKSFVSGETYQITIIITQTVNTDPPFFTMPVQIKFNTTLGDTTVTLFNDEQVQNFQFDIIGDPQSISFDPGNWILKTLQGIKEVDDPAILHQYSLQQNYPNQFNPNTNIKFRILDSRFVTLKVYDTIGNEVATLVNEEKPAGSYEVEFSANGLSSGTYFYKLTAGSFTQTKKMVLMK